MSAGGDSGEAGSTPTSVPRPYEWHLFQAVMNRPFGPFDPATQYSLTSQQILDTASPEQKAAAQRTADLEAAAYKQALEQASQEVGPDGDGQRIC